MSTIDGTAGNDTLAGTAGDDLINGGGGRDTAQIAASSSASTFSLDAQNHWVVSSPQGVDTLANVEQVQFGGGETISFGPEFRINSTVAGEQVNPVSVGLAHGGFAVAWEGSTPLSFSPHGIFLQQFDSNGLPAGPEILVSAAGTPAQNPSIARLANGSYVVSWNAWTTDQGWDIHAQLFDPHGARIGSEVVVNTERVDSQVQGDEAIAPLNDGGYMIMWSSYNQGMIGVQAFDATGAARPRDISGFGVTYAAEGPTIIPRWDGGAQVIWRTADGALMQEPVDNRGVPETSSSKIADVAAPLSTVGPHAAQLPDGGWMVAWSSNNDVFTQRFGRDGASTGPATQLAAPSAGSYDWYPSVAVLADGSAVVAWFSAYSVRLAEVYVQRFDPSGAPAGGPALVHQVARGEAAGPIDIAALADGGYLLTVRGSDGNGYGIVGQRFDASGVPVSVGQSLFGDEHDNVIRYTGTTLATPPLPLDGGAGNDVLAGAPGSVEVLTGGAGNDTFEFASANNGRDRITDWSPGDRITVDGAQFTGAMSNGDGSTTGPDRIDVGTTGNLTFLLVGTDAAPGADVAIALDGRFAASDFSAHDNVIEWARAAPPAPAPPAPAPAPEPSAQGTSGDDSLVGTSGNDRLDGLRGNDAIDGGGGTDTAVVQTSVAKVLSYSMADGVVRLTTDLGTLTLQHIERVQFGDALFALDTHVGEHTWQAAALFHAGFGVLPARGDLSRWTAQADASGSMGELAQHMIDAYAPGVSSHELVAHLYLQLAHQAPSADVIEGYVDQIGVGKAFATQGELLAFAANLSLNTDDVAGIVGTVQQLDPGAF